MAFFEPSGGVPAWRNLRPVANSEFQAAVPDDERRMPADLDFGLPDSDRFILGIGPLDNRGRVRPNDALDLHSWGPGTPLLLTSQRECVELRRDDAGKPLEADSRLVIPIGAGFLAGLNRGGRVIFITSLDEEVVTILSNRRAISALRGPADG